MKDLRPAEKVNSQDFSSAPEQDEIVCEFLSECREELHQLDRELNDLRQNSSPDDVLSNIFRTFHTIKGASGFLQFTTLESLTDAGESVLTGIREGRLVLSPAISAAIHEIVGCIRDILDTIAATSNEGTCCHADLLMKINRLLQSDQSAALTGRAPQADSVAVPGLVRDFAAEDSAKPIGQLLVEHAGVSAAAVQAARDLQLCGDLRTMGEILVSQGEVTPTVAREIIEYQQEARAASIAETSVRVEVALLDKLLRLADQLVHSAGHVARLAGGGFDPELASVSRHLLRVATQLHLEAMKTRVQPVATLEVLLSRLVRDLSRFSGKRVRMESKGAEIEVDRAVLGAIKDPLMHLIRNSIDHGIEPPGERLTSGKPMEGCITLSVTRSDGHFILELSDDGTGIDLDRVKKKAVEQGIVGPEQVHCISEAEIAELVFLPGFTTARTVSHISGRGVGMDIVKTKVERIGGTVELLTRRGLGTTVRFTIPVTLPSFVF